MISAWMPAVAGLALTLLAAATPPRAAAQCNAGTMAGRVNSVTDNPFQAEIKTITPVRAAQLQKPEPPMVVRDGQGRVRTDNDMGMIRAKGVLGQTIKVQWRIIYICDPVSREVITLDTVNKTATVLKRPSPALWRNPPMPGMPSFCDMELHREANLPRTEIEDWGHRVIEGLDAQGVMIRRDFSKPEAGVTGMSVRQLWCSEELGAMILFVMDTAEKKEVFHYAMTNIKRAEPDQTLFAIPADFKIVEK